VLTFKTQQTSSPQYLNQHISLRTSTRNTRSSSVPLLCVPFRLTSFAKRSFSTAAPLTWNSLPPAVLNRDSLSLLSNQDLKLICFLPLSANYSTYLFRHRLCSRLTALWRYINFVLLLLFLIYTFSKLHHSPGPSQKRPRCLDRHAAFHCFCFTKRPLLQIASILDRIVSPRFLRIFAMRLTV